MATQYMEVYKRIDADLKQNIQETEIKRSNGTASPEEIAFLGRVASPEEQQQYIKDKLFIETGEDVEDIFLAFKHHKLL